MTAKINFNIMIGIPGVGKSTYVENNKHPSCKSVVISTDTERIKLFGSLIKGNTDEANSILFKHIHNMIKSTVKNAVKNNEDTDIYYDATNSNRRRRITLYNNVKNYGATNVNAIYFPAFPNLAHKQNSNRSKDKYVPFSVILSMFLTQEIPRLGVDCDKLVIVDRLMPISNKFIDNIVNTIDDSTTNYVELVESLNKSEEFTKMLKLNIDSHDTPYHLEDINTHIDLVNKLMREQTKSVELRLAAYFHDLGKGAVKNKLENHGGRYKYHENIGAQFALVSKSRLEDKLNTNLSDLPEYVKQHMNVHTHHGKLNDRVIEQNNLSYDFVKNSSLLGIIDSKGSIPKYRKVNK